MEKEKLLDKQKIVFEENKSHSNLQIVELKSKINILEQKLNHYNKLENEIDKMVLAEEDDLAILKNFPTTTERRTSQAIFLARCLSEKTKEMKNLVTNIDSVQKENYLLKIKIDELEELNRQYVKYN